ncbi:hypothetical protein ACLMJK_009406 [Lecanora helva]
MKAIRAFDKVANYQHISERLSNLAASSKFRHLFQPPGFRFLDSYAPHMVLGRDRFVHAEVQIVTFHRLEGTQPRPRAIGTTKAACYLCNLFLSFHPQYMISATHGTLFDAWTIPDVLPYSVEDRRELQAIVQNMQLALEARVGKETHGFRPFPVQSGIYHVPSLPSLAGTVIGPAALVKTTSFSTIRSTSKTRSVTERPSLDSVGEAVDSSISDRDAVFSSASASQTHYEHHALAPKKHNKRKKSRLQWQVEPLHESKKSDQVDWKVVESDPGCRSHTKALSKAGAEDREVSESSKINKESRAHQTRRRDNSIQVDTYLEEFIEEREKCQTESPKGGVEGDVARSKAIQIAGKITTYRDTYETKNTGDKKAEDMLIMQAVEMLVTVVREADTASYKAYGKRSVELIDFFVCES